MTDNRHVVTVEHADVPVLGATWTNDLHLAVVVDAHPADLATVQREGYVRSRLGGEGQSRLVVDVTAQGFWASGDTVVPSSASQFPLADADWTGVVAILTVDADVPPGGHTWTFTVPDDGLLEIEATMRTGRAMYVAVRRDRDTVGFGQTILDNPAAFPQAILDAPGPVTGAWS